MRQSRPVYASRTALRRSEFSASIPRHMKVRGRRYRNTASLVQRLHSRRRELEMLRADMLVRKREARLHSYQALHPSRVGTWQCSQCASPPAAGTQYSPGLCCLPSTASQVGPCLQMPLISSVWISASCVVDLGPDATSSAKRSAPPQ